jgi:hypothetical protein
LGVGAAAEIDALDVAKYGEGCVPVGSGLRRGLTRLRVDRVILGVVAVQLSVGAELGGPFLPCQPVGRVGWDFTERLDRSGRADLSGVLADAQDTIVHGYS